MYPGSLCVNFFFFLQFSWREFGVLKEPEADSNCEWNIIELGQLLWSTLLVTRSSLLERKMASQLSRSLPAAGQR